MFQCGLYAAQAANLRYHIIETAFSNSEKRIGTTGQAFVLQTAGGRIAQIQVRYGPEFYITHQSGEVNMTTQEISECLHGFKPVMLHNGLVFKFYLCRNNK
ncbi:hypothetical protein [Candidatus Nitrotoga sp. 1052]|uniref:hypothetical protein n=1 Tax=Candidatus Nitrotoga sp. 1052 TaxID=2886964 RepID=UPI001EF467DF|nr:hypothetical protein [Candidatus Nitrotoga sp. 1052]CAH1085018.1 hypothetical protein NTG1052_520057 [Candidatus Nitrotoga sp. 1052]